MEVEGGYMKRTFIISDTHFFHQWQNIVKYTGRPQNHTEIIAKKWNSIVNPEDTIIHLGDVSCGLKNYKDGEALIKKLFSKLNGTKHLIKGNHDYKENRYYIDLGFNTVQDYIIVENTLLCHYPLEHSKYDNEYQKQIEELKQIAKTNNITEVWHGHSHTKHYTEIEIKHRNFAVELNNYSPVLV